MGVNGASSKVSNCLHEPLQSEQLNWTSGSTIVGRVRALKAFNGPHSSVRLSCLHNESGHVFLAVGVSSSPPYKKCWSVWHQTFYLLLEFLDQR